VKKAAVSPSHTVRCAVRELSLCVRCAVRCLPVGTGWILDVSNDATETTRADVTRKAKALGERGRCT
jgi:hypothetical protein